MSLVVLQQKMEETALRYQREGYFPSCTMTVFNRDKVLFQSALGDAKEDTLFDCASLTKIATSTQVLLAIDQGLFSLTSPLVELLPALSQDVFLSKRLQGITLFQLLTHSAGLPAWYPFYVKKDFVTALKDALDKPPETGVVYSDLGFILLGKVLEEVYQQPLDQCLHNNLVNKFSLGAMGYRPDTDKDIMPSSYGNPIEEKMVKDLGYTFTAWRPHTPIRGQTNDGNAHYAFQDVSGHAGLFADGKALARLAQMYLNASSSLLKSSMQEQAEGRGLGWQTGDMYPNGCGHTGFTGTSIYLSKALNIGCILLTNRLYYKEEEAKQTAPFRRDIHHMVAAYAAE